jgi:hypothetical protein
MIREIRHLRDRISAALVEPMQDFEHAWALEVQAAVMSHHFISY